MESPTTDQLLKGSVFSDYGTMVLMRGIGSVIVAILIIVLIFYPLYTLLWKFLVTRFPDVGPNLELARLRKGRRKDKDYEAYLKWAKLNGYEPISKESV